MTKDLADILVPLTTPFDSVSGQIDYGALRANAQALLAAGATGVVAVGSTGEAPLLSDEEARLTVSNLRPVVPDECWLIMGAGRESTRATIDACRAGKESGADVALVRAPSYFAPSLTEKALLDHFKRVADESPIPVLLYNMPKYTRVNFAASMVGALAGHENVAGAKDSSGNLQNFKSYREAAPDWSMLIGSGAALLGALELGAVGGIVAVANFACELAVEVAEAFFRTDYETAREAQNRLGRLHTEIVGKWGPAGVKAAMDAVGLAGGNVRAPLVDLSDRERSTVVELLTATDLQHN